MMGDSTKSWYALYTKQGCEKKVASLLSRKNIENYCPLKRHLNGRKKVVLEPLFNSYVFVQVGDSELQQIRSTDCVINFVYWLGKPAVIRDEEIEIMKRFMNEYAIVEMQKIPFDVNGMVRVINGLPEDGKNSIASVKNNLVRIVLPSLGYIMLAEVEKSAADVMTSTKSTYPLPESYKYAI